MSFNPSGGVVQDQQQLGTCYANSLSLMLESITGEPLSYMQMAMFNPKSKDREFFRKHPTDHWIGGGISCELFDNIKKLQREGENPGAKRICPKEYGFDNGRDLKRKFKKDFKTFERLFDLVNSDKVGPDEIRGVLDAVSRQQKALLKQCDKTPDGKTLPSAVTGTLKRKLLDRCAKAQFRVLDFGEKQKPNLREKVLLSRNKKREKYFP